MEQPSILSKAYNCDCLEYMRKLPDNYFDLAIADPPYGIGASRPSKKAERAVQPDGSILQVPVTDFTKKDWDNAIPTQEFFDELRRVSKNQIIWGANYFGLQGGMIVWDKINGNSDQYDCEIAYQSFNKRTDLVHYMWNGMFQGKYCGRDIRQAAMQQGNKALNEKRIHPTQKPVILYEWLLNNYAKKGDRIFDPMMGSQSSRIAAHRLGFDYVGCELDKEYFEKGCARFDSEWTKIDRNVANSTDMAENDNKSIRLMKSEISTLTPLEKEVIGSIVRGNGNLPDKMEGEEYDKLLQEVVDAEVRIMKRQPLSDRQREILVEENKQFEGGIEDFAKELKVDVDYLKASLSEHESLDNKPYTITVGTDNRPGGVEGEYHLQFKPDIMNVTFGEQEEVAKEFGGTMRVTDGQEWADFYHEADAVKFAEKIIGMNQERETAANKKKEGTKITVKGSHGKVLNLIPSDDPVKNRIVETLKDCLVFHDAKSVDDILDKINGSYEMKVWNRLNKELWEIAYRKNNTDISLKITPSDDLNKIKVIEHERRYYGQSDIDKPVGDFNLKELLDQQKETALLESYRSAGLGGNGAQFWPDKGALGIYQAFAFKDNSILLFKDADSEGIRLSTLPRDERQRIMDTIASLRDRHLASQESHHVAVDFTESREHLMSVLDSAREDIGDVILIKPTPVKLAGSAFAKATGVYLAPDGNGGGEYRLLGSYSDALAVEMNGHTEFNVCKILDAVASINGLAKAVHDVHVNHLEQGAKQAIRDRIVTPSARSFTPDQVEVLNHYHQVAAPDKPAGEVFKELLDEVAQEPDVARKPEKWVTDTAKELDDLAEDITRDQSRGLHI